MMKLSVILFSGLIALLSVGGYSEAGFPLHIGGAYNDYGKAVATDDKGNLYVSGYFQGKTDFGGIEKTAYGDPTNPAEVDIFIAKYSPVGNLIWVRSGTGPGAQMPHSVVVNGSSVYMVGYISNAATFEGADQPTDAGTGRDAFVCKYDTDGNFKWAFHLGDPETGTLTTDDARFEDGFDLAVDSIGNIYITGTFNGTINLDPANSNAAATFTGNTASRDIFVASYTADGKYRWGFAIGGSGQDEGHAIRIGKDGSVYVAGFFSNMTDFDPGRNINAKNSAGGWDAFLAKYDSGGKNIWVRSFGGTGNDQVRPGAMELREIDGKEYVFVGGDFTTTMEVFTADGYVQAASAGGGDIFLSRYDTDGNLTWIKTASGPGGTEFIHRIATDSFGSVYATGQITGTVDFNPGNIALTLTSLGQSDAFMVKYDKNGNLLLARNIGGNDSDPDLSEIGTGLAIDIWDNQYLTGRFYGSATYYDLQSAGGTDAFVLRFYSENSCLNIADDLKLNIFCAQHHGKTYQFALNYSPDSAESLWKADLSTLSETQSSNLSCIPVGDDLILNVPCAIFRGKQYQFSLNFYRNPRDLSGVYWRMDLNTVKERKRCGK
jgi:hypothetical protein